MPSALRKIGLRQIGRLGTLWLAALGSGVWAQTPANPSPELQLAMDGDASVGYNASFGNQIAGTHNFDFGGSANLKGFYFDPKFLSFQVSPYYNLSRLNSNYRSDFDSTGVTAAAQLFSGSHTPGTFSYTRDYNREGEFGIPDLGSYKTHGQGQSFGVGWGLAYQGLPSFDIGYNFGGGSSEVLGTAATGSNDFRTLTLGTGYQLHGFLMNASYLNNHLSEDLPEAIDFSKLVKFDTHQDTIQGNVSHRLPFNGNFQTHLSRTNFSSDFGNSSADQNFNAVTTSATMTPLTHLTVGTNIGYTDNLAASLLETVLPTAPGVAPQNDRSSNSLDVSGIATYAVTQQFNLQGWVDHRRQNIFGFETTSDFYSGGANYSRPVLSGMVGIYAGVSHYTSDATSSGQTGTTESVSYSRRVGVWSTNASFHYSRNQESAIASYTQSGRGYGVNVTRMVGSWRWNISATGSENALDSVTRSGTFSQNYNSSISGRRLSFTGTYAHSNGNAVQTGTGLVATPVPTPVIPSSLLILYGGTSYSAGGSIHPTERLNISASYTHTDYQTQASSITSENSVKQGNFVADYYYRQMHFVAGYNYLYQGIGTGGAKPANFQSLFVGVTRHFNLFGVQ